MKQTEATIAKHFSSEYQPPTQGNKKGNRPMATMLKKMLNQQITNDTLLNEFKKRFPDYFANKDDKVIAKELLLLALTAKGLTGDMQAIKEIMDRVDGKVKDQLEVSSGEERETKEDILGELKLLKEGLKEK